MNREIAPRIRSFGAIRIPRFSLPEFQPHKYWYVIVTSIEEGGRESRYVYITHDKNINTYSVTFRKRRFFRNWNVGGGGE